MHSSTASSRAQPQAHVDKVIMRVLQPGSKQYNGQGCYCSQPPGRCCCLYPNSHERVFRSLWITWNVLAV
eukprot:6204351-Pleurochrysis_carterae.AAC.4